MEILIILSRVPYPLEKGDKLRAFHQIRQLSLKHIIHLCCLNDTDLHPDANRILSEFCKSIHIIKLNKVSIGINTIRAIFNGKPLQVGYFYSNYAFNEINKVITSTKPDHIYSQLIRTAEYARNSSIKKTLDYQDVFSKGVERRLKYAPFWMKPFLVTEYKRLLKYENEVFELFDNKTIISKADRDLIPHPNRNNIHIIPNGVDREFFSPTVCAKTTDLLFTGNMGYAPNVQCAQYLVTEIMPILIEKIPGIKLRIAGANPDPKLFEYASPNVEIAGWVDDIRDSYNTARIFIAPMQIGTGLQNKLLEAMAMNLPCITSFLANNSLDAKPGKEVLIGNSASEYAQLVINLLEDGNFANEIARNGNDFVRNNYNWDVTTNILENIITNT